MSADELSPVDLLTHGEMRMEMRMPDSSNATFLVTIGDGSGQLRAIYKPLRGERPLWDFAPGLHRREVTAYRLARAMSWDIVPVTVVRDGPLGEGSVQLLVDADFEQHYFTLHERRPDTHDALRRIALFDIVVNNTDRKSGHVLIDATDHVWAIDHGLCFAADFKLRTVIWDFAGFDVTEDEIAPIAPLARSVPLEVASLLDDAEVTALTQRAAWLVEHRVFPHDPTGRAWPWPLV
jgi:uncharacterized repeat protein (TIGR03843 family)